MEKRTSETQIDTHLESAMANAIPVWELLCISKEEYEEKYCQPNNAVEKNVLDINVDESHEKR